MILREESNDVLFIEDSIATICKGDLQSLIDRLRTSAKGRVRFCAHHSASDLLHEMIILMSRATYIRPHKHLQKTESFHIIEGQLDVMIFDDDGKAVNVIEMGDLKSGKCFFYRMAQPLFHTVCVRSDTVLYHETTSGPFDRTETQYAPWSPDENASREEIGSFVSRLDEVAKKLR